LREIVPDPNIGGQGTIFLRLDSDTVLKDNLAIPPFKWFMADISLLVFKNY